jgi:hypothetical protein
LVRFGRPVWTKPPNELRFGRLLIAFMAGGAQQIIIPSPFLKNMESLDAT